MIRLAMVLHLFIGATLAGVLVIALLVGGTGSGLTLFGGALLGFLAAFPVSWVVAKKLYAR